MKKTKIYLTGYNVTDLQILADNHGCLIYESSDKHLYIIEYSEPKDLLYFGLGIGGLTLKTV